MGDGPGSTAAGRTAVDVFVRQAAAAQDPAALRDAVAAAQRAVRAAGRELAALTGCTLTAFVGCSSSGDEAAWLVQVGDSRAYRLRDGLLELLTIDHADAWLGVLNGWFTPDSPQGRAARYRLTRYVGHPGAPEPDLLNVSLRPGDLILLCTDGVADQVGYERIGQIIEGNADLGVAVETLLNETLATGDDNATAVLVSVG
jgi:serine/threonine protein phosphatase PrpC